MKIISSILTNNDCYKYGRKIKPKGLMLHSVGCSQPSANVFIKQWNKSGISKCVHAFIEADGDVYQTLPWDWRGWHGGGNVNNTHIGVEMCEPNTIRYVTGSSWIDINPEKTKEFVFVTYKYAVELFAYLCKEYKLNPLGRNVIISHSEGHKLGIASGHADVEHVWNKMGLTMDQFRKDVKSAMDEPVLKTVNSYYQTTANLNVREDMNTTCKVLGTLSKGEIVFVEESIGTWSKFKYKGKTAYLSTKYLISFNENNIKDGYNQIRMFDTDIHIYKTNSKEDVDVTLGVRGKLEPLSKITDSGKKIVAKTNGGFFTSKNEHLGLYVNDGLYYKAPNSAFIDFIYYKDGHTEIKFVKNLTEVSGLQPKTKWAIGTSWSLVVNGEINIINKERLDHSKYDNPRTMLGQKKDQTFLLVITEGRNSTNVGLNCTEEAELMKLLGAWNAVNLDGGGSTEMIVGNKIMNKPSDGYERNIGSAILIYKK